MDKNIDRAGSFLVEDTLDFLLYTLVHKNKSMGKADNASPLLEIALCSRQ
ncbi:MAG: hypothetical protein GX046_00235 [Tissierellia bacterium]|jgi:hypothetical protein|nr:hypothetical protein [Tissierellia bacterium]